MMRESHAVVPCSWSDVANPAFGGYQRTSGNACFIQRRYAAIEKRKSDVDPDVERVLTALCCVFVLPEGDLVRTHG
jgi:hypothetical protein